MKKFLSMLAAAAGVGLALPVMAQVSSSVMSSDGAISSETYSSFMTSSFMTSSFMTSSFMSSFNRGTPVSSETVTPGLPDAGTAVSSEAATTTSSSIGSPDTGVGTDTLNDTGTTEDSSIMDSDTDADTTGTIPTELPQAGGGGMAR